MGIKYLGTKYYPRKRYGWLLQLDRIKYEYNRGTLIVRFTKEN